MAGCSSGKKTENISKEDLGIIQMDSGKKIVYGMSREEAEKILGTGEKSDMGKFKYESGVSIFYRNNSVAAMILDEESEGKYKTTHDVGIGMLKQQVIKAYGENYVPSPSEMNLDYVYDTNMNTFINGYNTIAAKDADRFYAISSTFDENGNLQRILLFDCLFAIFME
ncbi:hypothetical protein [Paenibacillus dendrobii]|uniref:hypothetical protein n=1 Tax=Paenibacillus dendrobii TaxID=2691084 RepID=UPI001F270F3D|nr:hypothetical protein [Paenibacillus dendrobii]